MTEHPTGPLLRAEDYDSAPDDDMRAFLYLEEIARKRMYQVYEEDQNNSRYYPLRGEYMTRVAGLAAAFDIPGIDFNPEANFDNEFYRFIKDVDFQTTQISAGLARQKKRSSVSFEASEKAKIRRSLNQIKKCIEEAEISERRRQVLMARILEFETELDRTRSSFGVIATAALVILAAAADLKTVGVDISASTKSLVELVAAKRLEADQNTPSQLPPPLKLIEPPKPVSAPTGYDDLDDDIPF